MTTTVLLVDDSDIFRSRARSLLERSGFSVIGEARTASEGKREAQRLAPDVVLLDVQLPDGDGIDLASELADASARSRVVLISSRKANAYGPRLARSRASGFIYKPDLSRRSLRDATGADA